MDLPTYTSIWRIEKRLYKLYDFRLPMPLPIGQVTVFVAIAVPYVVLLQVLGLPFNHTLIWVYLLPPGLITWLVTRPVLESKRLPELIRSQLRYLAEPRVLCRMAPLSERDLLLVSGRVWRPRAGRRAAAASLAEPGGAAESGQAAEFAPGDGAVSPGRRPLGAGRSRSASAPGLAPRRPAVTVVSAGPAGSRPPSVERALAGPSARRGGLRAGPVTVVPGGDRPGKLDMLQRDRARAQLPIGRPARIVVLGCTVGAGQTMTTLLAGEVLANLRSGQVAVVDLNPGHASLAARAQARPALSQAAMLAKSRLIVVPPASAGTGGAGTPGPAAEQRDLVAEVAALAAASERCELVLADPATAVVPRLLAVADQLVLVAPASTAAPSAVAMTFEWLEAHGRGDLAAGAIMVLNGVSRRSMAAVEQAERVCAGRCRAIVRVPWDDQLQNHGVQRTRQPAPAWQPRQHWAGLLTPATTAAYIALAGVVVAALVEPASPGGAGGSSPVGSTVPGPLRQPVRAGQARP